MLRSAMLRRLSAVESHCAASDIDFLRCSHSMYLSFVVNSSLPVQAEAWNGMLPSSSTYRLKVADTCSAMLP
jgi:hypothetical protein